jgi:hypothetical protein
MHRTRAFCIAKALKQGVNRINTIAGATELPPDTL